MRVEYSIYEEFREYLRVEDILVSSSKETLINNLKTYVSRFKPFSAKNFTRKEGLLDFLKNGNKYIQSAKYCSGIRQVLQNSILVKSPFDITFVLRGGDTVYVDTPDSMISSLYLEEDLTSHPIHQSQIDNKTNIIGNNICNIKIKLPILIKPFSGILMQYPFYAKNVVKNTKMFPGILIPKNTVRLSIILQTPIQSEEDYIIEIKKDQPLAYLTSTEAVPNLKKNDKLLPPFQDTLKPKGLQKL